ncbi:MAG: leucine-rich repeat domain-containing protein, partial [Oscillospiraceae bacterium]|nr:leucine-rich repeat domain-containing protein [Oscillospiraceae bacterium]
MKRFLSGLLAAVLLLTCLPAIPLVARAYTEGIYTYTTVSSGVKITAVQDGLTYHLTVPETLGGKKVTEIGDSAFRYCDFRAVTLPNTVRTIGDEAFVGCTNMKSITLPTSLTTLGESAFEDCTGLTSVTIPEGITRLEYTTFRRCSALKSATVPKSVTYMASNVFSGCNALESLTIPFVGIGRSAGSSSQTQFLGYLFGSLTYGGSCTYQDYVNADSGVEYFYCVPTSLKSITITDTNYIPDCAFVNCTALDEIIVCDKVKEVGYHAVYNTGFYNNHPDGVVYLGKVACGYKGTVENPVEIKEGTVAIGEYAFYQNTELKQITLPNSVKTIGEYAFRGCTGLESCDLGGGLREIRSCAFYECKKLPSIQFPDTLTTIGAHAFYNCTSLEEVVIPMSDTTMENWAFALSGVKSVVLSPNVYSIAAYAFYSCSRLEQVYVPQYVYTYGYDCFSKCPALSKVYYVGTRLDRVDHMTSVSGNIDFFNASWHYGACSGAHRYSSDCDPTCNSCGWERRVSQAHTYTNACDNYCDDCYDYRATQHVYTDDCDTECN